MMQNIKLSNNPEIDDYYIGIINASGFTPPLSSDVAKTITEAFREVFTEEEINYFVQHAREYGGYGIDFRFTLNLKGTIVAFNIAFTTTNPRLDSISKEKIGKLYKLIISKVKFNIRNTGLDYYSITLGVRFKDIFNGTLDFSNLMRDINDGGYLNYYWKDGELHKFE